MPPARCPLPRRTTRRSVASALGGAGLLIAAAACAQPAAGPGWQFGAVLDVGAGSRALALGGRDQGLQLGHSDLSAEGPLGRHLRARLGAAFATHEGRLERRVEEAWLETTTLPAGLQLRGGRFASQIGRWNAQHPHADDFVERPLLYRAFLGGHWNDDGVRLNWTAPTPFYLMFGVEAFRGTRLVADAEPDRRRPGATTWSVKLGADAGNEHGWQLGLAQLRNRREAPVEAAHGDEPAAADEDEGHAGGHDHGHGHGARFAGRRMAIVDFTWKWAPGGDARARQLRVELEAARVSGLGPAAGAGDRHRARSLALVWRLDPRWEVGARVDRLRVRIAHDEHFDDGRLDERALMLAWKPSHLQSLRLQLSRQRDGAGFDDAARRAVQLQYVLAFGAHPAHAY